MSTLRCKAVLPVTLHGKARSSTRVGARYALCPMPLPTLLFAAALGIGQGTEQDSAALRFARDIRPILSDNCFACHGPDAAKRRAKLRLDEPNHAVLERGERPSLLVERITHADPDERMPPAESHKSLTAVEIARLRRWSASGASYARHWALEPPRRARPPVTTGDSWSRNFVDRWVRARLAKERVEPSRAADRRTLIRRVYFDLTGLPPTPEEIRRALEDPAEDAYEQLVDRLLASREHAERMASWWLDLVRYADTVGYHGDQEQSISPYRDWVLHALHDNMPFDRFTELQLAGDLQENATDSDRVASGYNRLLQTTHEGGAQAKEYLAIYNADRVRNFGAVWLGQTTGCAQCHDHKFDPITTRDFYALGAFFADIEEKGDFAGSPNSNPTTRPPELLLIDDAGRVELARIDDMIAKQRAIGGKAWRKNKAVLREVQALQKRRKRVEARGRRTMITKARETPREIRVLPRGNWLDDSGEIVEPTTPAYLPRLEVEAGRRASRRDLARWLFRADHPLTARVVVNRLFALTFGNGISAYLEDLGSQGEWPVHPELLDSLAVEFRESDWNLRHVLRLLVTSTAYRQSSKPRPELADRDPDNRWLARQSTWRLPAEAVRDTALSISGLLVKEFGGPSIKPFQPAGYYRHLNFPPRKYRQDTSKQQWRRGVYVHWQRQFLHPMLRAFDAPTREECCSQRPRSNTPQAALTLLNDRSFTEAARALAKRMMHERSSDSARIRRGFELATARTPSEAESRALYDLLAKHRQDHARDPAAAQKIAANGRMTSEQAVELASWWAVARVLLNLSETYRRS